MIATNQLQTRLPSEPRTCLVTGAAGFIGNNQPTPLMEYISALETALGLTSEKNYLPMQPGDVPATAANTDALDAWVGFKPNTAVPQGVARFVDWYRNYYKV